MITINSLRSALNNRLRRKPAVGFANISLLIVISLVCITVQLHAQDALAPVATDLRPAQIEAGPLLIGAGDLLEVNVFSTPELSGKFRVDQLGNISLLIGGQLTVMGLTPAQAAKLIEKRFLDGQFMLDPHVSVLVGEYATQGITVVGEVRLPGRYTLLGPHSLYDVLSAAGGLTGDAGATITIDRRSDPTHPTVIPVNSPNYSDLQRFTSVFPGDTISVSKADVIYVVGDVGRTGAFPMPNGQRFTVLEALAFASGLNPTAAVSKAVILRKNSNGTQSIDVDLNQVMKNKAPNIRLEASDVLVVPRSGMKVFLQSALPAATSGAIGAGTAFAVR